MLLHSADQTTSMKVQRKNSSRLIDRLITYVGIIVLISTATVAQAQNNVQCNGNVDLVFVLDASTSLSNSELITNYNFAKDIYTTMMNGVEGGTLLVGAIPYATDIYDDVLGLTGVSQEISTFLQEPARTSAIIASGNVGTQTGMAMGVAYVMITTGNNARSDAHKVVILITDGEPDDKVELYAALNDMENANIDVIVVAIGGSTLDFLERTSVTRHVSEELPDSLIVAEDACKGTVVMTPSLGVGPDDVVMDIVFVLDESHGNDAHFDSQKQFIQLIMNTFGISSQYAIVSVLKYGNSVLMDSPHYISRSTSSASLETSMDGLNRNGLNVNGRNLYEAFIQLKSIIDQFGTTGRPVIIVLVMSGISDDDTAAINQALQFHTMMNPNVYILVVGAGTSSAEWENQMKVMAFDDPQLWFQTASFEGLAGTTQASLDMVGNVRQQIYDLATGNFVPTNPGHLRFTADVQVIFMVDGSTAMLSMPHYAIVVRVIQDLVDGFNIPPALVSASLFDAGGVYDTISQEDNFNHEQFIYQLNNKLTLLTRTANADPNKGLDGILSYYDQNQHEGYHTIAYLIAMDSTSDEILSGAYARAMALRGIQLMIIGIGDGVDMAQLNQFQSFNGLVYETTIQTIASSTVLEGFKSDLERYAIDASLRRSGQYFTWSDAFDLIIVIDSELARGNRGVPLIQMLIDIMNRFTANVQIGVILVGESVLTGANQEILLNVARADLFGRIVTLNIVPSGGPDILGGLNAATDMFATHGRGGVEMVMLWFDGVIGADQDLIQKTLDMRNAGTAIFANGFGMYADSAEINSLAFHPELGNKILDPLPMTYTPQMDANLIAVARGQFAPGNVQQMIVLEDKCPDEAGIIILMDVSASTGNFFDYLKDHLAVLISGFDMTEFGFTMFSSKVLEDSIIRLGQYSTYADNYMQLMNLQMNSNFLQTHTWLAIDHATDQFNNIGKYNVVNGPEKVTIVITDGQSLDRTATIQAADNARAAGITVVGLKVGTNNDNDELENVVGDPDHNLFSLSGEGELNIDVLKSLQKRLCQIIKPGECAAGKYFDITSVCTPCSIGYYQPGRDQTSCIKCPDDKSTIAVSSTSETDCTDICSPGQYLMVTCVLCPENTYKGTSGFGQCTVCPVERPITIGTGSTSIDDCIADTTCPIAMDLMLIIDASASITSFDFNLLKWTLIGILDKFGAGTRVAITTIGSETLNSDVEGFIDIEALSAIYSIIQNLESGAVITNTASALKTTREKILADTAADKPVVTVVFTDGASSDPLRTALEAARNHLYEIKVVVIGVGENGFTEELSVIASDPASQYVLTNSDYSNLLSMDIPGTICTAAREWEQYVPTVAGVCELPVALVFVVDLSLSITDVDIALFKAQLVNFVVGLSIEDNGWGVGFIFYDAAIIGSADISYVESEVVSNIQALSTTSTGVGTATDVALDSARTQLQETRQNLRHMMVVLSDGSSSDPEKTKISADQAKADDIEIVVIGPAGVSTSSAAELRYLSSSGKFQQIDDGYLTVTSTQLTTVTDCQTSTVCHQPIQTAFIWYINDDVNLKSPAAQITQDLSKMMADDNSGLVVVDPATSINTVDKAWTQAGDNMKGNDVVRVIVTVTDQGPTDADLDVAAYWMDEGVIMVFVTSDSINGWEPYASSYSPSSAKKMVFVNNGFTEDLVTTKILWSICKEPCNSGFEFASSGLCDECPLGFYRDRTKSYQCEECSRNPDRTTDGPGKTSSVDCRLIEDDCPTGFEKKPDGICYPCPKNTGRDQYVQEECTNCPKDFFTLFTGSSLEACLPPCDKGEYWNKDTETCEKCATGTYNKFTNQFKCEECPGDGDMLTIDITGAMVDGATDESQCIGGCEPGSYWDRDQNDGECVLCPEDTFQDNVNKTFCLPCHPGTTTSTQANPLGSTSRTNCDDPCPSGETWDFVNKVCVPCGEDKYKDKDDGDNICKNCPAGLGTDNEDSATSVNQCLPGCAPGGGEYWNTEKQKCFKCEPSTYQGSSSAFTCLDCPAGWSSPTGSTSVDDCYPLCGKGEAWSDADDQCVLCSLGEYGDEENQESCKSCANGGTTPYMGATDASLCDDTCNAGEWKCADDTCVPGTSRCNTAFDCQADTSDEDGCECTPGQFFDLNLGACVNCEIGDFQEFAGQFECIGCSDGRTTATDGSTSRNDCIDICDSGLRHTGVECEICAIGTFREQNVDNPLECTSCPDPFSTRNEGSANVEACISVCDEGKYFDVEIGSCTLCELASFQGNTFNEYECTQCPPGTTTLQTGAKETSQCIDVCLPGKELPILGTVEADCVDCPAGSYKSATMTQCGLCPDGGTSEEGSDSEFDCYPNCSDGEEFNDQWTGCQICSYGSYKPNKATPDNPFCEPCGVGKSTQYEGSTSSDACIDMCQAGMELSGDKTACNKCPQGSYREPLVDDVCTDCPDGFSTPTDAATSSASCSSMICPAGKQVNNVVNPTACVSCGFNNYRGPNDEECKPCEDGKKTYTRQATSAAQCYEICIAGRFLNETSGKCQNCSYETYQPEPGQNECIRCPKPKYHTNGVDRTDVKHCKADWCDAGKKLVGGDPAEGGICVPCGYGYFRGDEDPECLPCPNGGYTLITNAISAASCQADPCKSGYEYRHNKCSLCQKGFYKTKGSTRLCVACPTGQTTKKKGATGVHKCTTKIVHPCDAGFEDIKGQCVPCKRGFYKTERNRLLCAACPPLSTTNSEGSTSAGDCTPDTCVPGQQLVGVNQCEVCPIGFYKETAVDGLCIPCPDGFTTYATGADGPTQCIPICPRKFELIIAVDLTIPSCGYVRNLRSWLKYLINSIDVHQNNVRVGIIRYGKSTSTLEYLRRGTSSKRLCSRLTHGLKCIPCYKANSKAALEHADHMFGHQSREGVDKVMMLMTANPNGCFEQASAVATNLKNQNIDVVVISTTDENLASDSSLQFIIPNYSTLPSLDVVIPAICERVVVQPEPK